MGLEKYPKELRPMDTQSLPLTFPEYGTEAWFALQWQIQWFQQSSLSTRLTPSSHLCWYDPFPKPDLNPASAEHPEASRTGSSNSVPTTAPTLPASLAFNFPAASGSIFLPGTSLHSFSSASTVGTDRDIDKSSVIAGSEQANKERKPKVSVPEHEKGPQYWERRRKNNEAAKKSRNNRRAKEQETAILASHLERENKALREENANLKADVKILQSLLSVKQQAVIRGAERPFEYAAGSFAGDCTSQTKDAFKLPSLMRAGLPKAIGHVLTLEALKS